MAQFKRLPPAVRKQEIQEIQEAAINLFLEKGFCATTMENIIERVSLSKGGVYRIYPSTIEILSDIMRNGMSMRNQYYKDQVEALREKGRIDVNTIIDIIYEGMFLYPEIATLYVEFLIEKRRNNKLELLYQEICQETKTQTWTLIQQVAPTALSFFNEHSFEALTYLMNTFILGMIVLPEQDRPMEFKKLYSNALLEILNH